MCMKILFITDLYPVKEGEKTTPKTLHNFVISWIKKGHSVDVIKPNFVFNSFLRKKPFYKTGFYDYDSVKIFNVNYFLPFIGKIENKLPNNLDIYAYDIVIAHMPSGIIFADILCQKYKKPLVTGVHSSDLKIICDPKYSVYFKPKLIKAFNNAKKIACRSFVLQKKFCTLFPQLANKTFAAPSGIDSFVDLESILNSKTPLSVLTCANLIKRKNIDKIILAISDTEGLSLNIIGDGKEYSKLKKLAKKSKNKITFLKRLPHEKVIEEMKKTDIFLLASTDETFGMVYLEAMASGCITVCSKNDGIDGIIVDEKNGFLCEPTKEGIKETLIKIKNWHEEGAKKAHFFGAPTLEKIRETSLQTIKKLTPEACADNYIYNIDV